MIYWIKFLYSTFLFPPGILIIALLLLCFYLYRQKSELIKIVIGITVILYLSAIPLVGDVLIGSLESRYQPPRDVHGDVIIMLGGGATLDTPNVDGQGHLSGFAANRLLTCAQLYNKEKLPILISGGKVLKTTGSEADIAKVILMGLGVPEEKIIVENKSLNTAENAKFIKEILVEYGFEQPILVTSAFHMERSVLQFAKAQLSVIPYPTDYQANLHRQFQFHQLWPTASAMLNVSLALKEYLGIIAVKWY